MIFIIKCETIVSFIYLEYKASTKEEALESHIKLYGDADDVVGIFMQIN